MSGAAPGFDPSVNPTQVAARVGLLRLLQQGAVWARGEQDRLAHASLLPGDRVASVLPGGRVLGRLNMPREPVHVEVTDWGALLDWAKERRPDQVEEFTAYRLFPAFVEALLADARRRGVAVDHNGEEIPGIAVSTAPPSPTMSLADDAAEQLADALADPATRPAVVAALEELVSGMLGMPGITVTVNVPDSGPEAPASEHQHEDEDAQGGGDGGPVERECGQCGMATAHAVVGPGRSQCLVCGRFTGDEAAAL